MNELKKTGSIYLYVLIIAILLPLLLPLTATTAEAAALKINKSKLTLFAGDVYTLKIKGTTKYITWTCNKKSIAKVDTDGTVITLKKGKAVITAIIDDKKITCTITVKPRTEEQVSKTIEALRDDYPDGMPWDNSNLYGSNYESGIGGGCYAFANEISDIAFGYSSASKHKDFDKIKIGDIIRIGDYHSVVVLTKSEDSVTVVEGNLDAAVHWDREITREELINEGFQVTTRY